MAPNGLHDVLEKFVSDAAGSEGFRVDDYSISFGKIWRGNTVIGYLTPNQEDGPKILPTSQTSHVESDAFASMITSPPAGPTGSMPPMTMDSPEGQQGEPEPEDPNGPSKGPPEQGGPPPEPEPGGDQGFADLLKNFSDEKSEKDDPANLGKTKPSPPRESIELLRSVRLQETRRKYVRASAALEFDIESKKVAGGEKVVLYLLPVARSEGKYELYDFTVTTTATIPTAHAVSLAVAAAVSEATPHVSVNRSQLVTVSRRVYSVMKAAKDVVGGYDLEESVSEEIARYFLAEG